MLEWQTFSEKKYKTWWLFCLSSVLAFCYGLLPMNGLCLYSNLTLTIPVLIPKQTTLCCVSFTVPFFTWQSPSMLGTSFQLVQYWFFTTIILKEKGHRKRILTEVIQLRGQTRRYTYHMTKLTARCQMKKLLRLL